ncbi:TetR/AcrR family transcriptional regulator [Rhodococcus sp. TAF43]|uniref:TetR/AcrR family transcriptional regulator n=1 Tax=Rhodococcus sp. TAF43 TaxID=3237483 RepID=UPI003F979EB5
MPDARPERADAARNRRAILAAAQRLFTEHGPDRVSVDQIAAAAGVGKATVFHRFGSRNELVRAVVYEQANALRQAVLDAPPPLGPGAPADARLVAFLVAFAHLIVDHPALTAAYDASDADGRADDLHGFWYDHLSALITEVRPDMDPDGTAVLLLAMVAGAARPLAAGGARAGRIVDSVEAVARSIVGDRA